MFYVRQEPPELLSGGTYTGPIQGVLKSFDYEGNVLDSVTIDLVYNNYGGENYYGAGPFEAVYYAEGDTLSIPTATRINAVRGAPIVADPQGVGSNAVPTYVAVVIHSISFNWDHSGSVQDAMTVLAGKDTPATVPEWPIPAGQIYQGASQAAYFGGITPKIKALISVIPPDKIVRIHPVSAKCGNYSMMPTCFPMLPLQMVTGTGDYEFEFGAAIPQGITYMTDYLWWKIVLQSGATIVTFPFVTGPHDMYAIDRPPVDSMADPYPWVEVLRYSTYLVSKDYYYGMTDDYLLNILADNLYKQDWSRDPFFGNTNSITYNEEDKEDYIGGIYNIDFHLSKFLIRLQNQSPYIQPDCYGISGFLLTLSHSLGVNAGPLEIKHLYWPIKLSTHEIMPIGLHEWRTINWDLHLTVRFPQYDDYGWIYESGFKARLGDITGVSKDTYFSRVFTDDPVFIESNPKEMNVD